MLSGTPEKKFTEFLFKKFINLSVFIINQNQKIIYGIKFMISLMEVISLEASFEREFFKIVFATFNIAK